jgi:hypothetical protein
VKKTTHFHQVRNLRMRGVITPLPRNARVGTGYPRNYLGEKVNVKLSVCLTKHLAMTYLVLYHTINLNWCGGIAPSVLNLGTTWR